MLKNIKFFTTILLLICIQASTSIEEEWIKNPEAELPPSMQICKRTLSTDERNLCILNSINSVLPTLKQGFAPLGIPSIDPHKRKTNEFEFKTAALHTKLYLRDEVITGITDAKIKTVKSKVNDKNLLIELTVLFPTLHSSAKYKGDVKYNDFTFNPNGNFNATFSNITGTCKFLGKLNNIDGEDYMLIKSFDISNLVVGDFKISVTGLLPDPDVNAFALEFINRNWRLLYPEVAKQTKSIWEPMYIRIINFFFARVPFRRLMPKE